jgi:hypothetical protein
LRNHATEVISGPLGVDIGTLDLPSDLKIIGQL